MDLISKEQKQSLRFKAERDKLILFHINVNGFMVTTALNYEPDHPRVLKGKSNTTCQSSGCTMQTGQPPFFFYIPLH